ncbi:MAG TPA: peroxidase-related enzyme [Steroidobacteraceae bacterium]|nr:peroxidase-related enzyme [Steroidobacteraceae bacterium]
MSQPKHLTALKLRIPPRKGLDADMRKYFDKCDEKLGFVPNVLKAYSFDQVKLRAFVDMYNDLMLGDSRLSKLEREMIAVVVSSHNECFYCLTAHGQAVRFLSGDPKLGELMVMNYRTARLSRRQRVMLDFAHKLTADPATVGDADRERLRKAGFRDRDIWDIAAVAAFFNMTNRFATAIDMMPNEEYHALAR